jgi:hypothetical protein
LKAFCASETRFSRFALGLLGLALCVFLWGLQYKLSLYDPPQSISHKIPTAKLLSKDEQGATKQAAIITAKDSTSGTEMFLAVVGLVAGLALFYRPVLVHREAETSRPWGQQLLATLSAFSFRPPPILA